MFRFDSTNLDTQIDNDSEECNLVLGRDVLDDNIQVVGWTVQLKYGGEGKDARGKKFKARIYPDPSGEELPEQVGICISSTEKVKCTFQVFFVAQ